MNDRSLPTPLAAAASANAATCDATAANAAAEDATAANVAADDATAANAATCDATAADVAANAAAAADSRANPLLQAWSAPFGMPPFAAVEARHVEPALRQAMREHRAELDALASRSTPPTFDDTVAAFDRAGTRLFGLLGVFHTLTASATTPELQRVQREMAAPLSAHFSAVYLDARLFARIDTLHRAAEAGDAAAAPTPEARRLLQRQHLDFVRAGARLQGADRQRLAAVMAELAQLTTRFAQNVLHDESSWALTLPDAAALAGLPPFLRSATRQAAADRGADGHVVTLSRSLVVPFLTYSTREDLRRVAWQAWTTRGEHPGEHDNREVARDILRLRREQAALLGHGCYADHALADTMAGSRQAVHGLLDEVWPRALAAVAAERAELLAQMKAEAGAGAEATDVPSAGVQATDVAPWDWRFWAEKVRVRHYAVDDAEVKPYFPLAAVVAAAFDCAGRLFGLRFVARDDVPVYHPDVRAYEVRDAEGRTVGLFLQDNFARAAKKSGAWMNAMRYQSRNGGPSGGEAVLPVILNNNNFARGAADAADAGGGVDTAADAAAEPTLLSMDDARTLFHEFGHGLHGLLSDVTYQRLSGTQVLRDFVELPSQLFEHWILQPEVLRRHARHWRSGEPMPDDLIARLERARGFGQGYETVRYVASAIADMAVHSLPDAEPPADLCAWEAALLAERGLPAGVGQNHRLVHFQHLFSGSGYAAGYYVYLWAEVLDADGFGAFEEAGDVFDAVTAERLRRCVYGVGNAVAPGAAYVAFRGRAATVAPLLAKRGWAPSDAPDARPAVPA